MVPQVSRHTTQRRLKECSIHKYVASRKPLLSESNKHEKLAWAQKHENWQWRQWSKVCWCDEMSVCKIDDTSITWVFRLPWEK